MSLSKRLARLERQAGLSDRPACRDRRGLTVLVEAWESPDGSVGPAEDLPAPCPRCGEVPEQVVEIVEIVVDSADAGPAGAAPLPGEDQ